MKTSKFYKIVRPIGKDAEIIDNQSAYGGGGSLFGKSSWYNRIINGAANRKSRYREYDIMDNDSDIALALDYIAEEMCGNAPKGKETLKLEMMTEPTQKISNNTILTLRAALKTFTSLHRLEGDRLFNICRNTVKYGDTFFMRSRKKNGQWMFIPAKNIDAAVTDKYDLTHVKAWMVRSDYNNEVNDNTGVFNYSSVYAGQDTNQAQPYKESDIVRFSLFDETSEEMPFGLSILRPIYKVFKQKELLEDSIVIYRIQRAPERRAFYIDVGRAHPHEVSSILEKVKNDFRQKRIPSQIGGKSQVDAIYNPQSMQEDFFLAVRPNGQGTRIETLPGGQNLGNLDDLQIFFRKIWRGLKIPESYINTLEGDGGSGNYNDGKVGIAMMQEIKFSLYIERLQNFIETTLDQEFKRFVYDNELNIDPSLYRIRLPEPSNFKKSRDQEIDIALINTYTSIASDKTISNRFALRKYLQLTDEEIALNERLLREEKGLPVDGGREDIPKLYNEEGAEAGGFEGGLGGVPAGGDDFGGDDLGGLEGIDEPSPEGDLEAGGEDTGDAEAGEETPET